MLIISSIIQMNMTASGVGIMIFQEELNLYSFQVV